MNEWWNQYILIQLKYPSEFWLCFLLFHQKCPVKTESGGSRGFGNGIFPSALSFPSAINRETPDFGQYLPVSRLEYEVSGIIAKSLPFIVDLTFQQWNFKYFGLFEWLLFLMLTLNVSSQTPVCNFDISQNVIGQMLQSQQHLFRAFCITANIRDDLIQKSLFCTNDIIYHPFPINSQYL